MSNLGPPPIRELNQNATVWQRWFNDLRALLTSASGLIGWTAVSKSGSNLTDIETRNHADLQNINTATYTHLSATDHTDLTDGGATTLHKHDHGLMDGLGDDDHTQYILANGTRPLSADWDAGDVVVRASSFYADVATGTAPFTCVSTTVVVNLNSDYLDGQHGSYYLDSANFTGTNWGILTAGADTTLHYHATDRALANATGTLAAANGGTGLASYTIGDMIYASGTTTLSSIAAVATGNALISGGVGAPSTWGKIGLTTHISGTLAIGNGGTGQTTATAAFDALAPTTTQGDTIYYNGTDNVRLAKGTAYQALNMNAGATAPEWQASLQSLMTAQGDIVYASAANTPARLAKGTASQVLTMNAGATAPEWATPSSGGINDGVVQSVTAAATTAINLASGDNIELTVDTNITALSLTNPGTVNLVYLVMKNTDGGSYTITQPSSFNAGLTCPTSDDTGRIYSLYTEDAGVHWAVTFVGTIDVPKRLYGWGTNSTNYELGALAGVSDGVQMFAAGYSAVARSEAADTNTGFSINSSAQLFGWGDGAQGVLGNSSTADQSSPVQIGSDKTWSKVATGQRTTLAITTTGQLWAWGSANSGALGDGTIVQKSSPVQIGALTDWAYVAVGQSHCAAVKTDGTLWTWGTGSSGALGDGTTVSKSSPVQIGALTNWATVSASTERVHAIKTDGTLWAWGEASSGVIGDGTVTRKSSPIQIGALTDWAWVATGNLNCYAIKTDGTLWAWGDGTGGALGDGTTVSKSSPVQIGALTNWAKVVPVGASGAAAIKTDGTLWAWGTIAGFPAPMDTAKSSPVQLGSLDPWNDILNVGAHLVALG